MAEKHHDDDIMDKVMIFSSVDERLEFLGKLLNNGTSRQILALLAEREMTSSEISLLLKLSLPLVIHHLEKMIKADMVAITRVSQNSKNQPMKHYKARSAIVILPERALQEAKQSRAFSKSLRRIMKFSAIAFGGFLSGMISLSNQYLPAETQEPLPEGTILLDIGSSGLAAGDVLMSIIIGLGTVIAGLIIERTYTHIKKHP